MGRKTVGSRKALIQTGSNNKVEDGLMWWRRKKRRKKRRKRRRKTKKGEKEEFLLKQLCGDDAELYDVLGLYLYEDPVGAISRQDLDILIGEAEKSFKDEDYREARQRYMRAMDKAIFEATQNPGEKGRYNVVIQDLASKTVKATEKVREIVEKEGPADYASSARSLLEGSIKRFEFLSKRSEDVTRIASLFYNERLEELGSMGRREARRQERRDADVREEIEDKEASKRREERGEERKEMGRGERRGAEKEDKEEEKKQRERRNARKKKEQKLRKKRRERRKKKMRDETRGEKNSDESCGRALFCLFLFVCACVIGSSTR